MSKLLNKLLHDDSAQTSHSSQSTSFLPQHAPAQAPNTHRFEFSKDSLNSVETGKPIYHISRPSKTASLSLSGKPPITITRSDTNTVLGTVKVDSLSSKVTLVINGRQVSMKAGTDDLLSDGNVSFTSSLAPQGRFHWIRKLRVLDDKQTMTLKDAPKGGNTLAVIEDDEFTIMVPAMNQMLMDEVIVSGIGMMEMIKKEAKYTEIVLEVLGNVSN